MVVLIITGDELPWRGRCEACRNAIKHIASRFSLDNNPIYQRIQDQPIQQGEGDQPAPWGWNIHRAETRPECNGDCRINQCDQHDFQAEILTKELTRFIGVGFKHHK